MELTIRQYAYTRKEKYIIQVIIIYILNLNIFGSEVLAVVSTNSTIFWIVM
jgi:hypothetical protein